MGSVFSQYKWRGSNDFSVCMCPVQRDQSYHHSGKGPELRYICIYPLADILVATIQFGKLKNRREQAITFVPSILVPFPSFVDKSTLPYLLPNFSSVTTPLILALYPANDTVAIAEESIPIVQDLYIFFVQIIPLRAAVLGLQRRHSKRS